MSLPPLPKPDLEGVNYELWGQNAQADCWFEAKVRAYAAAAVEAEREQCAERVRLVSRIERLRGLCKTAVGMLHDAGRDDDAEVISELIGDMEV